MKLSDGKAEDGLWPGAELRINCFGGKNTVKLAVEVFRGHVYKPGRDGFVTLRSQAIG